MLEAIERLATQFRKLPSVGKKTAYRYAFKFLTMEEGEVDDFISAVRNVKESVNICSICGNYTEDEICNSCKTKDKTIICVVKEPKDIIPIEKLSVYNGVYHVLNGVINFQKGIKPDDINLESLFCRLNGVTEVVLALDVDLSGELTSNYLAIELRKRNIKVTRLATGIPIGSEIEFVDEFTLGKAFQNRREV